MLEQLSCQFFASTSYKSLQMSTLKLVAFAAVFAFGLVIVSLSLLMNRNTRVNTLSNNTNPNVELLIRTTTLLPSTSEDTIDLSDCQEDLSWIGDGFCDDATNVPTCNFDGGDCCLDEVLEYNCILCLCYNDIKILTESPPSAITSSKVCTYEDNMFIGDGICDQDLNHEFCRYDGGDCCDELTSVFCDTCPCFQKTCPHDQSLIGDNVCHDETNNQLCDYDGLDCCESVSNYDHCTWCECIIPLTYWGCAGECVTEKEAFKGDGFCDDENNIKDCEYDGGDCCGPNVNHYFCFDCECLEPGYGDSASNGPSYPIVGK